MLQFKETSISFFFVWTQGWRTIDGNSPGNHWIPRCRDGLCPLGSSSEGAVVRTQNACPNLAVWKIQGTSCVWLLKKQNTRYVMCLVLENTKYKVRHVSGPWKYKIQGMSCVWLLKGTSFSHLGKIQNQGKNSHFKARDYSLMSFTAHIKYRYQCYASLHCKSVWHILYNALPGKTLGSKLCSRVFITWQNMPNNLETQHKHIYS